MKELSIEQKARRYDEAIERAKGVIEQYIFPELKESEDEKVRKKLINIVKKSYEQGGYALHKWEADEMLAWLEKQDEKKPADKEYTFKAIPRLLEMIQPTDRAKSYCQKLIGSLEQEGYSTDAKIVRDCLKQMNGEKVAMAVMDIEKQGEQPPKVTDDKVVIKKGENPAWSEEDEKIYQSIMDDTVQENQLDDKQILWLKSLKERIQPQPKQECKQENTGDLTDFENAMMHIGGSFFGQHAGLDPNDTNTIKEQANLLLQLVPKQEWSEDDEQYLLVCKNALRKYQVTDKWDSNIISQWLDNKLKLK